MVACAGVIPILEVLRAMASFWMICSSLRLSISAVLIAMSADSSKLNRSTGQSIPASVIVSVEVFNSNAVINSSLGFAAPPNEIPSISVCNSSIAACTSLLVVLPTGVNITSAAMGFVVTVVSSYGVPVVPSPTTVIDAVEFIFVSEPSAIFAKEANGTMPLNPGAVPVTTKSVPCNSIRVTTPSVPPANVPKFTVSVFPPSIVIDKILEGSSKDKSVIV